MEKQTYIIINGSELYIKRFNSKDEAIEYAQNYMNQSEEIIVRYIHTIHKLYENII